MKLGVNVEKLIWLYSDKESKYDAHFKLLKESEIYKSIPIPPVVNLKDKDSDITKYYLTRLQEEYVGSIFIVDDREVFISKDN